MPSTDPSKLSWKHRKAIGAANQEKRALAEQLLDEAETALNEALQDIHDQTGVALRVLIANMRTRRARHGKPVRQVNAANVARSWVAAQARERNEKFSIVDASVHQRTAAVLAEWENNAEAWQLAEARHIEQREKKRVALRIDYKQRESDTIRTADSFQEQAAAFSSRTGGHACGFIVRGDIKDTAKPTFYGDELSRRYFVEVLKTDPVTFAQNFEAFCTSGGARGLAESTAKRMCALKSYIRFTLSERLQLITNDPARTMSYKQFGRDIEDRYRITLQGWPLPSLKNPSEVSNIAELDKIRAALDDGACFFRQMTTIEIQQRAVVREQELTLAKEKRTAAAEQREASKAISAKRSLPVHNEDRPLNMASTSHARKRLKLADTAAARNVDHLPAVLTPAGPAMLQRAPLVDLTNTVTFTPGMVGFPLELINAQI
ncbi:hypothetical protein CALCODRAFT_486991 [Calocera cornea HHB12733]|uniref:Uncharacterized protein n=1 Tax=Calocera cornea HHB12733 TaxID=1353952 RepID=A0A165DEQ9_9BASI|nr:hypothetical protein CALCODRAFT_488362 [Calocera cornea HHB12733]KZT52650.1 hypothetical protein CALCODRAFT_486991 [Calocera cornea HHB12733]